MSKNTVHPGPPKRALVPSDPRFSPRSEDRSGLPVDGVDSSGLVRLAESEHGGSPRHDVLPQALEMAGGIGGLHGFGQRYLAGNSMQLKKVFFSAEAPPVGMPRQKLEWFSKLFGHFEMYTYVKVKGLNSSQYV